MNQFLSALKKNNPSIIISQETEHYNVENLWEDEGVLIRFEKTIDLSPIQNLSFPPEFSAILHLDKQILEIIFSPLPPNYSLIGRAFDFHFEGELFKAEYKESSEAFKIIATAFREKDSANSKTEYRNLKEFRDYYRKDSLPPFLKKYYEDKVPINFQISGNFSLVKDLISFCKHINFYMSFYERHSPMILIFEKDKFEKEKFVIPCYSRSEIFPNTLNFLKIDPVLLDLFEVVRQTSNIRLKFLFYYQVLEYCSYYYLNDELKRKLTNIVKNPDLLNKPMEYSKNIIEEFKDYFKSNDDTAKLEKLINEFVDFTEIKQELKCNWQYFSTPVKFDGDFVIPSLISAEQDLDSTPKNILRDIKRNIESIRNVLVHIRESRENKVILPTSRNNHLLFPYLYLIRRIAERIAIKYSEK